MMTATFAFLFATWVPGLVINVVSSAVNPVIRRVCTMILSSFANNGTSTRLATVAVSYSVVSVGALDGVSLGLLDGSLDRSSLGSLDGDEGGGSGNDDKTATTEENKYFGFVGSPDLFVWKKHVRNLFRGNGTENTARRVSSRQL